jgi:hypothetical protein
VVAPVRQGRQQSDGAGDRGDVDVHALGCPACPLGEGVDLSCASGRGLARVPVEDRAGVEVLVLLAQGVDGITPTWREDIDEHDVPGSLTVVERDVGALVAVEVADVAPQPGVDLLDVVCGDPVQRLFLNPDQEVGVTSGPLRCHIGHPVGEPEDRLRDGEGSIGL